uniref:NADH-ubiquinone oxidoreductase chain 5 n=1 Tax=Scolytinae sp. BMNH 1040146 TaxID=1903785 RepID=A0A343A561_9CUCU|nr:NADH dehydrogenase subunit 5 [Scolytinae sp. BMNH 1040146]
MSFLMFFMGALVLMLNMDLIVEFNLFSFLSMDIMSLFYLDWMSFLFMSFVLYISCLIMNYTAEYMIMDKTLKRFVYLMLLFVLSMMIMIVSMNMITILLGWDGLGLVSYALVVYYQNVKSFNAGMLTVLSNRVGDAALLMSIAWLSYYGSWNFMNFLFIDSLSLKMVFYFCILAAFTKSAQIPFSSWLPAAMAAPTPVSALVHSSTLVTAGVYLLIRMSLYFSEQMMNFILFISLFTMFMAGVCANLEFDLKKIIALSTLSQLGMMLVILSLGSQELAYFHLLTHALFKALLFMCAGAIIHSVGDTQDIRLMGNLGTMMPVTSVCMHISNLSLCGIPFLSGFFSKDLIAEILSMEFMNIFIYLIFYVSIGLTVSYSVRLSYFLFFININYSTSMAISCESNKMMINSMLGLIFMVIFMGSVLSWLIQSIPYFIILPFILKTMTLIFIMLGVIMGYELIKYEYYYNLMFIDKYNLINFLSGMWNLPVLSTLGIYKMFLFQGKESHKLGDYGWLEYYGSSGLFKYLSVIIGNFQYVSVNNFKLFCMVFSIYLLLFVFLMEV